LATHDQAVEDRLAIILKTPSARYYEIYHDLKAAPHALFVHWGTKPHLIKPKNKKALRWAGPNGWVFAQIVHHPGYKGDPYLENARSSVVRGFTRITSQAWDRVWRRLRR
jgi:hypothetical protein